MKVEASINLSRKSGSAASGRLVVLALFPMKSTTSTLPAATISTQGDSLVGKLVNSLPVQTTQAIAGPPFFLWGETDQP